eukprot:comp7914_c0_seq1/m.3476 comp7914_c0_seq1/g.3476  ORF comp7914_c0_seq1/g.3476 comp7914_c0_seq1/m.3476 type:complete len:119 (-) comp7914_c0_seq1:78-434(-)
MGDIEAARVTEEQLKEFVSLVDELERRINAFYDYLDQHPNPSLVQAEEMAGAVVTKAQEIQGRQKLLANIVPEETPKPPEETQQAAELLSSLRQKGDGMRANLAKLQTNCKAALKAFA